MTAPTSYPYFSLSQRLGLPYRQVLELVRRLERRLAMDQDDDALGFGREQCDAIYDAWRGELNRRRKVKEDSDAAP